jgi:hypothetical protein
MIKKVHSLLILVLMISCSTGNEYIQNIKEVKRDEKKFNQDFEDKKTILEKFKVTKKAPGKIEEKKMVAIQAPVKKVKHTNVKKRKPTPKKIVKKIPRSLFPPDYPEKLMTLDKASKVFWNDITPPYYQGEKIYMDINYLGVTAGKIVLESKPPTEVAGKESYHLHARIKSAPFYRFIYEVDDTLDSYLDIDSWKPLKYSLIQRESKQDIDDLQIYDHEKHKTYFFYRRVTEDKKSKKTVEKYTPVFFQDAFSIVHFLRGLPLEVGKKYTIPMVNKAEVLKMNVRIAAIEKLQTKIGTFQTYRIDATTETTGKTFKSDKIRFWYTADARRIFLKFQADVQIGKINGDIEKYEK